MQFPLPPPPQFLVHHDVLFCLSFFFLFTFLGLGRGRENLKRRQLIGLLYQPRMIDDDKCGAVSGMRIGRVN
jgi:hypothetical protein